MATGDDVTRYVSNMSEEERRHELKLAKIEAKKAKDLAKEERLKESSDEYLLARIALAVIIGAVLLLGGCMYTNVHPSGDKIEKDKEQYEICMKYEHSDERCTT